MPTVAELDVQIDATNNASDELRRLNAELDRLAGRNADVEVNAGTGAASADLRELIEQLRRLGQRQTSINLDVYAGTVMRQLEEISRRLQRLTTGTNQIDLSVLTNNAERSIDRLQQSLRELGDRDLQVNADVRMAQARLRDLERSIDAIEGDIRVDVDTSAARAEAERVRAQIDRMRATIEVDADTRGAGDRLNQLSQAVERAGTNMRGVIAGALLLWPALIPLAASATAAVGGFISATTTAGIGVGVFGAVATTVYNDVTDASKRITLAQEEYARATTATARKNALAKIQAQWDQLTPSQAAALRTLKNFQTTWSTFAGQFEGQVFDLVGRGLSLVASLLPRIAPMVSGVATALGNLLTKAQAALAGPFWSGFIDMLNNAAGPALETLLVGLGNIIKGFAGIIMAFSPFQAQWNRGFVGMTESFANWGTSLGQSRGFQNFMDYAKRVTPLVIDFLGNLVDALVGIVRAVAPYGNLVLGALDGVLRGIQRLAEGAPTLLAVVVALTGITTASLLVAGPVLSMIRIFQLMIPAVTAMAVGMNIGVASLLGLAAAGVAAVVGLAYAYARFETFHDIVNGVFRGISDAIGAFLGWASRVFANVVVALDPVIEAFKIFAIVAMQVFLAAGEVVVGAIGGILGALGDFIEWASRSQTAVLIFATVLTAALAPAVAAALTALGTMVAGWVMAAAGVLASAALMALGWARTLVGAAVAIVTTVAHLAAVIAGWALAAAQVVTRALLMASAWLIMLAGSGMAQLRAVGTLLVMIAVWSWAAVEAVARATVIAGAWLITTIGSAFAAGGALATLGTILAGWAGAAVGVVIQALAIAGAWLITIGQAAVAVAASAFALAAIVAGWIGAAATATANALRIAAAWLIANAGAVGAAIAAAIGFAAMVAGWIGAAATAMASALTIGAAWLIALGPIGLIIAAIIAVGAAVYLIYRNWGSIVDWFAGLWESIKGVFASALGWITEKLGTVASFFGVKGGEAMQAFGASMSAAVPAAVAPVAQIPVQAEAALAPTPGIMSGIGGSMMSAFGGGATAGMPMATAPFNAMPQLLTAPTISLPPMMGQAGFGAMGAFGTGAAGATSMATAPFAALPGKTQAAMPDVASLLGPDGAAAMKGFGSGALAGTAAATAPVAALPGKAKAALPGTQSMLTPKGVELVGGFANGITTAAARVKVAMGSVSNAVYVAMSSMGRQVSGSMGSVARSITSGFQPLAGTAARAMAGMTGAVNAGYRAITNASSTNMARMVLGVRTGWTNATSATTRGMSSMTTSATSGSQRMSAAVRSAMDSMVEAIRSASSRAVGQAQSMASGIVSAVSGIGGRMFSAGSSAGSNLAQGIRSQAGAVEAAARSLAAAAARPMPGSPAEVGPLSGRGYSLLRGQRFGEDLATGIGARAGLVERQARDIADLMTLAVAPSVAFDRIAGGVGRVGSSTAAQVARGAGGGGTTINMRAGAVTLALTLGEGVDPDAARAAFDGAGTDLAEQLALQIRRG